MSTEIFYEHLVHAFLSSYKFKTWRSFIFGIILGKKKKKCNSAKSGVNGGWGSLATLSFSKYYNMTMKVCVMINCYDEDAKCCWYPPWHFSLCFGSSSRIRSKSIYFLKIRRQLEFNILHNFSQFNLNLTLNYVPRCVPPKRPLCSIGAFSASNKRYIWEMTLLQ